MSNNQQQTEAEEKKARQEAMRKSREKGFNTVAVTSKATAKQVTNDILNTRLENGQETGFLAFAGLKFGLGKCAFMNTIRGVTEIQEEYNELVIEETQGAKA